jgi:hypothetical protein
MRNAKDFLPISSCPSSRIRPAKSPISFPLGTGDPIRESPRPPPGGLYGRAGFPLYVMDLISFSVFVTAALERGA